MSKQIILLLLLVFVSLPVNALIETNEADGVPLKNHETVLPQTLGFNAEKVTEPDNKSLWTVLNKEIIQEFLPSPAAVGPGEYVGDSMHIDQDTLIMGVAGYAVIFELEGGDWVEKSILRPPYEYAELFGKSVAIQGDVALVGAPDGHGNSLETGVVYVFRKSKSEWELEQILSAQNDQSSVKFGSSIAFVGNDIVIGDNRSNEYGYQSGAAYVYQYNNQIWEQSQTLPYIIEPHNQNFHKFSGSLAANDSVILVGADGYDGDTGIVYVFTKNQGVWQQSGMIQANNAVKKLHFGKQMALDGSDLVVSATRNNNFTTGQLFFFENIQGEWVEQLDYIPPTVVYDERLGNSLGLKSGVLVASAQGNEDVDDSSGAAYVFEKGQMGWEFKQKIYDPMLNNSFGKTVVAHDNHVLIKARNSQNYTFEKMGQNWVQKQKVELLPGASNHLFSKALYVDNDVAVFSSYGIQNENNSTVVYELYIFEKSQDETWSLALRQSYSNDPAYLSQIVSVKNNTVLFFDGVKLNVLEKSVNGWGPTNSFDIPFLAYVVEGNNTIESVRLSKLIQTDDGIISKSYDYVNNKYLIHSLSVVNNELLVQDLWQFTPEAAAEAMIYADGILYLTQTSEGPNPQNFVKLMAYEDDSWVEKSIINSPTGHDSFGFGKSISVSKNLMAIGVANTSYEDMTGIVTSRGNVHLYKQTDNNWVFQETLYTDDFYAVHFGSKLYLNDETLVVTGRHQYTNDIKLMEFEYINGWQYKGLIESSYGENDEFAEAFKGLDNNLMIGMPRAGFYGTNSGRAALYKLNDVFTVSGNISNLLHQNSLKLKLNDREVISVNGSFTFDMKLPESHNYNVEIIGNAYPFNQSCQVNQGSGVVQQENISDIEIVCDDFVDLIFDDSFEGL